MDTLLSKESPKIIKCLDQFGPNQVTVLLMVQPGHLSCLQTLEYFLLETDATDYLAKILTPLPPPPPPPPLPPIPVNLISEPQDSRSGQQRHTNSRPPPPTWLSTAITTRDGPLLHAQDADRLEQGLCTIQNIVLVTPVQLQNTCHLSQLTSQSIYDFFNTDQPI
ncbi:hypothetical protein BGX23_007915 [Mortierella sp. AD031]|nr:hypothetical protein BGX23_007915 [Mortierella sp. AD031]